MTRELSSFNPPDHVLEQLAELAAKECSFVVKGIRSLPGQLSNATAHCSRTQAP